MFNSLQTVRSLADVRTRLDEIEISEECSAVLTLTRTANQALTTAGTIITWQSELRNYQFTWAGTDITIPASGWYVFGMSFRFDANLNNVVSTITVNGQIVQSYNGLGDVDRNNFSLSMIRYFAQADVIQVSIYPSANCNLVYALENTLAESPIFHIVQVSGAVG